MVTNTQGKRAMYAWTNVEYVGRPSRDLLYRYMARRCKPGLDFTCSKAIGPRYYGRGPTLQYRAYTAKGKVVLLAALAQYME